MRFTSPWRGEVDRAQRDREGLNFLTHSTPLIVAALR
jgi:hypothetical protein